VKTAYNKKNVLVTGATGYLGKYIVESLLNKGWDVGLLLKRDKYFSNAEQFKGKADFFEYTGTTESVVNAVLEFHPELVIHLASLFLAWHETKDITNLIESNVLFGTQLLEAMAVNKVTKFLNTGTFWQHYNNEDYNPVCLYAATKESFEKIARFYVECYSMDFLTLKLFDIYGPDDPRRKLFTLLREHIGSKDPLMMSPCDQKIDLVFLGDVVEAFLTASELLFSEDMKGMTEFAVSSGKTEILRRVVEIYFNTIGKPMNVVFGGRPYRNREIMEPWKTGKILPGWSAKTGLIEGIKLMEKIE